MPLLRYLLYLFLLAGINLQNVNAAVVAPATGGAALCATSYTTLGPISINESVNADFPNGAFSITLLVPPGYVFNAGAGAVSFTPARDITSAVINVTATTITINYTAGGIAALDAMTITGIQVKASAQAPVAGPGNIVRPAGAAGGTAPAITGIIAGTTNFGTLTQLPSILLVNSLADAGAGTLRQAITDANNHCGRDTIVFNLGAAGPYTINLASALPNLTDNAGVLIDGWSNPGALPNTIPVFNTTVGTPLNPVYKVVVTCNTNGTPCFSIASNNNIIRGLVLASSGGNAANANDAGVTIISGNNNAVLGCYIGMDATGLNQGGGKMDVGVSVSSSGNIIGDGTPAGVNLLAGLNGNMSGIQFTGAGSALNSVKGNIIGIQSNGSNVVPANVQKYGINFLAGSGGGNIIGGTLPGEGNVISGNLYGIFLAGSSPNGTIIQGNIIGPQANGNTRIPSNTQTDGIWISGSPNNTIGGSVAGARNIISANEDDGIYIELAGSTGNVIKGNYIGLDKTGTSFIASTTQGIGIWISAAAGTGNIIGGTAAGEGNVISGSYDPAAVYGYGIFLSSASGGTSVLGNIIGPQKDGATYVTGNLQVEGIDIYGSPNNIIGGNTAGARNIISANETFGVVISLAAATGNIFKGNYIGIDITGTTFITGSTQNTGILVNTTSGGGTQIGGNGAGDGNLISGQSGGAVLNGCAIDLTNNAAAGTTVKGNIIGPQKNGTSYLAANNQVYGVLIDNSPNNIVGGTTAGDRNIISANEFYGVQIDGASGKTNVVKGNYIGCDATLGAIAGSSQDNGVYINTAAANNTIGGTLAGEANIIAFNTIYGLNLTSLAATGNKISGNPVYRNNGGKPINLNYGASQANNGLAIPVILVANNTVISGTAPANANVEVFSNSISNSCFDAYTYVGSTVANGAGNWSLAASVAGGDTVLATATNAGNSTSEFSLCVPVLSTTSITTSAISPVLLCRGGTVNVSFTITGTYNAGNIFTAQLSNSAGSFAAPVSIGTLTSTTAGVIPALIPGATAPGTGYRIRVIASNPVTTGTDNGANLTISPDGGAGTWTWQGTVSTNWFDPCNWDKKCLPDLSSDVIIPGSTPVNPLITGSTGTCNTIKIQTSSGANLTINTTAGGKLQITQ
ncbi:MAG: beta strand repeat-containing protein [Cytophagaceae bacterium]